MSAKDYLPVFLDLYKKKILVVGGGNIAYQKLSNIKKFNCNVTVIAPFILEKVKNIADSYIIREIQLQDLDAFFLVYACTDNLTVNKAVSDGCKAKGILVCVADNPLLCDFISPAVYKKDNMVVSISSGGKDVRKSIAWRDRIKTIFNND